MYDQWTQTESTITGLDEYLQIRYVKLHFTLELLENGILPKYKVSALRGGMGQVLLMMYCAFDENCDICTFLSECTVRRIMYPEMTVRPFFMTKQGKDNEGYIIECEDYRESFEVGDVFNFNLLLFGRTIVYFPQFLQAFCCLGDIGLGTENILFRVSSVTNTDGELLYDGFENILYKEHYQTRIVSDYVNNRLTQFETQKPKKIVFHSPLSLKYQTVFQTHFNPDAIMAATERRIFILNCFEGTNKAKQKCRFSVSGHIPLLEDEQVFTEKIRRYSEAQSSSMVLTGIKGFCRITEIDEYALKVLLAGELMHIGKNTTFGFGRYTLIAE